MQVSMAYYQSVHKQRLTNTELEKPGCRSVRRSKDNSAHKEMNKDLTEMEISKRN